MLVIAAPQQLVRVRRCACSVWAFVLLHALLSSAVSRRGAGARRAPHRLPASGIGHPRSDPARSAPARPAGARLCRGPQPGARGPVGQGNFERLGARAAELVQLKVAVIVTGGAAAAQAARGATSAVPIVMVDPGDPVRTRLIASLSQPGGNMTGVELGDPGPGGQASAAPQGGRTGSHARRISLESQCAGRRSRSGKPKGPRPCSRVKVQPVELRKAEELDDAFSALARAQAQGSHRVRRPVDLHASPADQCRPRRTGGSRRCRARVSSSTRAA